MSTLSLHCENHSLQERRYRLRRSLMLAIAAQDVPAVRSLATGHEAWHFDAFHQELPRAIRTGSWPVVEAMLECLSRKPSSLETTSPLCIAAEEGAVDIMRQLLAAGASVNEMAVGFTPMMGAVQGENIVAMDLLVEHGARMHVPQAAHDPFFHACAMGKSIAALHLVDKGALDGVDRASFEEALAAIDERHVGMRQALLAHISARQGNQIDVATGPAMGRPAAPRL